jgi:hypothetical protein
MTLLLILSSLLIHAKQEGIFWNYSQEPVYCLGTMRKNVQCLEKEKILPKQGCIGDAILLPNGKVFKIPDKTTYVCGADSCSAFDWKSVGIMQAARVKNGKVYGDMSLLEFENLFPNMKYCDGTVRQNFYYEEPTSSTAER